MSILIEKYVWNIRNLLSKNECVYLKVVENSASLSQYRSLLLLLMMLLHQLTHEIRTDHINVCKLQRSKAFLHLWTSAKQKLKSSWQTNLQRPQRDGSQDKVQTIKCRHNSVHSTKYEVQSKNRNLPKKKGGRSGTRVDDINKLSHCVY